MRNNYYCVGTNSHVGLRHHMAGGIAPAYSSWNWSNVSRITPKKSSPCAYAIMSNHYHLVLHVNKDKARSWSEKEVINRWLTLFKGNLLVQRYINYEKQSKAELDTLSTIVSKWRDRLMDISWFMRCLNESIARKANEEDHCKGRFWPLSRIPALHGIRTSLFVRMAPQEPGITG